MNLRLAVLRSLFLILSSHLSQTAPDNFLLLVCAYVSIPWCVTPKTLKGKLLQPVLNKDSGTALTCQDVNIGRGGNEILCKETPLST